MLEKAGAFGDENTFNDYLKSTNSWKFFSSNERKSNDNPERYKKITADEYEKYLSGDMKYIYPYMSFDDYKKVFLTRGFKDFNINSGVYGVPETISNHLYAFWLGASKDGYGRGKDARIEWDKQSGFSNWLDKHSELQLNTDSTLYRGIRLSDKGLKDLQKAFENKSVIDFAGPSSWSISDAVAHNYLKFSLVGQRNKNLAMFEEIGGGKHKAIPMLYGHSSELIYSGNSKFDIVDITQDDKGVYHVKVKEIR